MLLIPLHFFIFVSDIFWNTSLLSFINLWTLYKWNLLSSFIQHYLFFMHMKKGPPYVHIPEQRPKHLYMCIFQNHKHNHGGDKSNDNQQYWVLLHTDYGFPLNEWLIPDLDQEMYKRWWTLYILCQKAETGIMANRDPDTETMITKPEKHIIKKKKRKRNIL